MGGFLCLEIALVVFMAVICSGNDVIKVEEMEGRLLLMTSIMRLIRDQKGWRKKSTVHKLYHLEVNFQHIR